MGALISIAITALTVYCLFKVLTIDPELLGADPPDPQPIEESWRINEHTNNARRKMYGESSLYRQSEDE